MDDEHEVYGGEIPDDAEDADMDAHHEEGIDKGGSDDFAAQELEEMKRRLKEMEEEAAALRDMQAKVEKEMGTVQDPMAAPSQASKEEADSRSVFVGNVDYSCTPEEVQQHFQSCGTVNRVTILTDKFGQPKGYAYVEFVEVEAVPNALQLNESELHGRPLKVTAKRTNVPGMKSFRGRRGANPYYGYMPRRPYMPTYGYSPYGRGANLRKLIADSGHGRTFVAMVGLFTSLKAGFITDSKLKPTASHNWYWFCDGELSQYRHWAGGHLCVQLSSFCSSSSNLNGFLNRGHDDYFHIACCKCQLNPYDPAS